MDDSPDKDKRKDDPAEWAAQHVGKETAQEMFDDFQRGGPPHMKNWNPE